MKKTIIILMGCLMLTGCSLIPRMTFDTKGTTPQSTEKAKRKVVCKGEIIINEDGTIDSCTKGFYEYTENYNKQERKFTLKEKIINFFRNLVGNSFWLVVILIILIPGFLGIIIERIFSVSNKALRQTVEAIRDFRKNSDAKEELDNYLRDKQDKQTKKIISNNRVK